MSEVTISFPPDHPAFAGHFPGNPVVPGALLLAQIIDLVETGNTGGFRVTGFTGIKFLAHVRPQEQLSVLFAPLRPGMIRFECRRADKLIATGSMEVQVAQLG